MRVNEGRIREGGRIHVAEGKDGRWVSSTKAGYVQVPRDVRADQLRSESNLRDSLLSTSAEVYTGLYRAVLIVSTLYEYTLYRQLMLQLI